MFYRNGQIWIEGSILDTLGGYALLRLPLFSSLITPPLREFTLLFRLTYPIDFIFWDMLPAELNASSIDNSLIVLQVGRRRISNKLDDDY